MYIEFILIFILSLLLVNFIKHYGEKMGFIDIPNDRSVHVDHTPRAAGIGFFLAVAMILPLFHFDYMLNHFWIFFSIFLVFIIGVLDDHHDASPNTKFIVLILSSIMLFFDHTAFNDLGVFFGWHITLGWFALFFNIFAIVGFTNALNLIDGLDGLAAIISLVILGTYFTVGYTNDDFFMMWFSMAFISTLLAFLIFNWNPASIFMGDSGSLTLGFVITILSVKSLEYLPAVSILFITAVPLYDTLIVMIRRKFNGRSAFLADRCHMHHILRHFFAEDTKKTVLFLGILQANFAIIGLLLNKNIDEGYLLILFILNMITLYIILAAMIKRQKRDC